MYMCTFKIRTNTGWQRPIGCLTFRGHFPQKSLVTNDSFAKRDLQLIGYPMHLRHPVPKLRL